MFFVTCDDIYMSFTGLESIFTTTEEHVMQNVGDVKCGLKWRSLKSWYFTCKLGLCWRDGLVFWIRYFMAEINNNRTICGVL